MTERLFLFLDESGSHTRSDLYVVAGCWCLSPYTDVHRVLQPTRNRLSDNVVFDADGPSIGREIKGARVGDRTLDSALVYLRKIGGDDGSITTAALPWNDRYPIRFTTFESDSGLGTRLARSYLGEGRASDTSQIIALCSLVSPLLHLQSHGGRQPESFHVVLDADTWKAPANTVDRFVDGVGGAPPVEFVQYDSHSVPGLQLADVAAYVRRQWIRNGACERASSALDDMRL